MLYKKPWYAVRKGAMALVGEPVSGSEFPVSAKTFAMVAPHISLFFFLKSSVNQLNKKGYPVLNSRGNLPGILRKSRQKIAPLAMVVPHISLTEIVSKSTL